MSSRCAFLYDYEEMYFFSILDQKQQQHFRREWDIIRQDGGSLASIYVSGMCMGIY